MSGNVTAAAVCFSLPAPNTLRWSLQPEVIMTVYKRPGTKNFLLDVTGANGQRIRRTSGTDDLQEARRREASLLLQLMGPKISDIPASNLSVLIQQFVSYQKGVGARSWKGFFQVQALAFQRWLGSDPPISSISLRDLQHYQAHRAASTSPSTANRSFQVLHRMFAMAVEWDLLRSNPAKGIKKLREPGGHERFLAHEEQRKLIEACQEPFQSLVFVALRTGMRRGELLSLRGRDVDLRRSLITLPMTKKGTPRHLHLLPQVRDILSTLIRRRPDQQERIFVNSKGRPYSPWGVKANFQRAVRRSGLPKTRFHDLRHTFASDALAAGVSLAVLRDFLGHSTVKTTERYAHLADEQIRSAVGLMSSHAAHFGTVTSKSR